MNLLLKPLRNARFSFKVGGGFITMGMVSVAVAVSGGLAILDLREQSDLSAKSTSSMAALQQVAQAQENYLTVGSAELAAAASDKIAALGGSLNVLDAASGAGSTATSMSDAITGVGQLGTEFEGVVTAVEHRNKAADSLQRSAVRLETLALQIADSMSKVQREASSAAKSATSARNRADKLGRFLSDMEFQAQEMSGLLNGLDGSNFLKPEEAEQLVKGAAALVKSTKKAMKFEVDGIDPKNLKSLAGTARAIAMSLPEIFDGELPKVRALSARQTGPGFSEIQRVAASMRMDVYNAIDTAKKAAGKAQSSLTIVDLVGANVAKFLNAALGTRSATMEYFAGFETMGVNEVTNRIGILRNLTNTLIADSAAFPQISDAVAKINGEVDVFEAGFGELVAAREEFTVQRQALAALSADVRTVITSLAEDQSQSAIQKANTALLLIAIALIAAIVIGTVLVLVLSAVVTKPTRALTEAMGRLADGDTGITVPSTDQGDEIGDMSRMVEVFRQNARERLRLEGEAKGHQEAQSARQDRIENLIQEFRNESQDLLGAVEETSEVMNRTASSLMDIARSGAEQAGETSKASETASMNVESVAGAAEELAASIAEIGSQVTRTSEIVSKANGAVHESNSKVNGLADAAGTIGTVISLIQDIAEQTNLLALNATIEAARAGEAGKGFAVVASEVKELANQTSKATEEIGSQVQGIQASTREAVDSIATISQIMEEVDGYTQAITAAVTEQGAATQEISGNVMRAAEGTSSVKSNMHNLARTVDETRDASTGLLAASEDLSHRKAALKGGIETFLKNVSAA